ncbi:MAG: general secretion pathway protein GspB, partial [Candidatus Thiodiazotropha sp. (ex Notomyrtea botanica)]|nr:general secretion pathway protein GspB [Candidatus Thiodiazotropha sp. (ex Notomyrtea botanica)]
IPLVWELPQGLREKILQLKSSIHVYSETPEQRFVIINMKRYKEGDSLQPNGFRLERIDRDGVVIDHGDGLVRLLRR